MAAEKTDDRFLLLLVIGVAGRILLSWLPSIKPAIPAIAVGAVLFGAEQGVFLAAGVFFLSNLIIDGFSGYGFGDWMIWQILGGALAAVAVAHLAKKPVSSEQLVYLTVVATLVFELVVNVGSAGGLDLNYFMNSAPFILAHLAGNVVFAILLSGFLPKAEAH